MPRLSKHTNCTLCGSPDHKALNCPRRELSAKEQRRVLAKAAAASRKAAAKDAKAAVRAAAKEAAASKEAAAKDAARTKAAAKLAVHRVAVALERVRRVQEQAVHAAAYAALVAAGQPVLATVANYRNSRWMVVCDVCIGCNLPARACMC